ncbi:TolC family protein [Pelagicoccus sp. SDUM812005]|uniref:TolC family protein n=1 Tax=Pelagicoccus sp. SDUM812005 TaxID=3041257 RepID=UPI00280EAE4F|nr:TolC family protein [Pelagicoccus sp. SDUM812005]MDQ8181274.1 TolC family protein [Pelagicoccus sp. SDUM812005]
MAHQKIPKQTPSFHSRLAACALAALLALPAAQAEEPSALTLPQAINLALDHNIGLQRSGLAIETRVTTVDQAQADYSPDLSLRLSENVGLSSNDNGGIFEGEGRWSDSSSASLSSSLSLYNGGARQASLELAKAELEAATLDFDRDRQALLYNTVSQFFQTLLRSKEIAIQLEELATRREELERIQIDVENGIRTESEYLRQQALVSNSERLLAQARNAYANSLYALKNILRIPAPESIVCEDPNLSIEDPSTLSEPNLPSSLAALEKRPDLSAQKARLYSAEKDLVIARSGKRPTVSASASLSTGYSSNTAGSFSDQALRDEPRASAGISVSLPIFDKRRTELSTLRSRIALQQEELILENLRLSAETALYQAEQDYQTAKLQLAASQNQLAATESALEAELSRYEAGAATLLEVNSLRSSRLDAAVAVEEARFALFTSRLGVAYEDGTIESFLRQTLQLAN